MTANKLTRWRIKRARMHAARWLPIGRVYQDTSASLVEYYRGEFADGVLRGYRPLTAVERDVMTALNAAMPLLAFDAQADEFEPEMLHVRCVTWIAGRKFVGTIHLNVNFRHWLSDAKYRISHIVANALLDTEVTR